MIFAFVNKNVMALRFFDGYCKSLMHGKRLKSIIGIRGIKRSPPLYFPLIIIASTALFNSFFTTSLVPSKVKVNQHNGNCSQLQIKSELTH